MYVTGLNIAQLLGQTSRTVGFLGRRRELCRRRGEDELEGCYTRSITMGHERCAG